MKQQVGASLRMTKQQGAPFGSRRHDCRRRRRHDEWAAGIKSETITGDGENRISRRYSASHATSSFREEEEEEDRTAFINNKSSASSRSNFTISSTVSSPGFNFKALQGRRWEGMGRGEGLALNSKWNEAEKYICNPLSGEVPVECLSANTRLCGGGGRSFRSSSDRLSTRRVSMSAPLFYPPKPHNNLLHNPHQQHHLLLGIITDKNPAAPGIPNNIQKGEKMATTCHHHHLNGSKTSRNCSPAAAAAPTPSSIIIQESSVIMRTHSPPSSSTAKVQSHEEKREEIKESRKKEAAEITGKNDLGEKGKQETAAVSEELRRRRPGGGCLSWRRFLWMRKRERDKEKLRGATKNKNSHCSRNILLCPIHQW